MKHTLFDSELKLMEILWEKEPVSAKELSLICAEKIDWNKNTTYTVIKKLVEKGVIERSEPGFICRALIDKNDVRKKETESLISRLYGGSKSAFFSSLIENKSLTKEELEELKKIINEAK